MRHPGKEFLAALFGRFEPRGRKSGLTLGLLKDVQGEPLDEVFLEEGTDRILIHAHEGSAVRSALVSLLTTLGVGTSPSVMPSTLSQELAWALETAVTDAALDAALANLRHLPNVKEATSGILDTYAAGRSLFNPESCLLYGSPNAGKSTLLNALAGRERSVVHELAGTTRDLVEVAIPLGGRVFHVIDAAGIRDTHEALESVGVDMAVAAARNGRVLWVVNPHHPLGIKPETSMALVLTHQDLGPGRAVPYDGPVLRVGLGGGAEEVRQFLEHTLPDVPAGPILFTQRQKAVVEKSLASGHWDAALWAGS